MKTIQLGRPIEINQETDKLLQSIAEAEGDTLDPKVLKAAIPDSGLFIEFLERHNLKDTPEAKSILRQLGSLGLITAARVGLPTKKKTAKPKKAVNPAFRQLDQLRKTVKALRVRLERETRARKIEARVKSEAQKARTRLASQIAELREQGRKLATDLRSALGDASKRDAARQQAIAKIAELKAEYAKKSAELRSELSRTTAELARKSEELKKLAGEAAHRAVEIIRGEEHHAAPAAGASSEPHREAPPQETAGSGYEKEPEEEQ
jgi:uncharacterized phage infection (PIP) family protein YhgE